MVRDAAPFDVEISIVTLGALGRLGACISSLPDACVGLTWRLTVIDNSVNGVDLAGLLETVPAPEVIRSEGRRGFAANQNLALSPLVRTRRARYVLILNDDTELDPHSIGALVGYADGRPNVGAVAPLIRDTSGRPEPSRFPWPTLRQQTLQSLAPRANFTADHQAEGWLHGACLLVRVSALRDVGVFDPAFFLFFEDTDLCLRLQDAGWELQVCECASIVHHGHKTVSESGVIEEMEKQVLRSRFLFFSKHYGRTSARAVTELVRCALMLRTTKMVLEASLGGRAAALADPRTLWALTRFRPSKPTNLETDAGLSSPQR